MLCFILTRLVCCSNERIAECIENVASLKSTDTSNFQSFSSQIMKLRSVLSKVVSDDEACLDAIAKKERANEEKAKVSEELEEKIGVKEKEAKVRERETEVAKPTFTVKCF